MKTRKLLALLLLFVTQGAWADTGYVGTTSQVLKDHPDEPAIQVVRSTYNMTSNLNVYEFKLRYFSYASTGRADYAMTKWGYKGDVWLTINGTKLIKLSDLKGNNTYLGDNTTIESWNGNELFTGWDGYANREIASAKSNISQVTDVYVSLCNTENMGVNSAYNYYGSWKYFGSWNLGASAIDYTKVVTVRVGIERAWSHKSYTIGVTGNWYGGGAYDPRGVHTKTAVHEYTTTFDATAPTVSWPSGSGTVTRSGNGKITYKAPSGLSTKSVPQIKVSGDNVSETEYCTFQNNVYLMKNQGNTDSPWTSIDKAEDYYAKIENVSSNQTQEFSVNDNYNPVTVYPCWEFQSQNEYVSMPTLGTRYKQSHDKFLSSVTAPGFPKAKVVNVETKNVFSKQVRIWWQSQVADKNNCNTNGKWRVFRKPASGSTLTYVGETNNYSSTEVIDETGTIDYEKKYHYVVIFQPSGWTVNQESDALGLSTESTDYELGRSFDLSITEISASDSKMVVNWAHTGLSDATATNKYYMEVQRSLDDTNWTAKKTIEITDSAVTEGSWEDTDIAANTTYYYRIRFQSVQGQAWVSASVAKSSGGSSIVEGSFMASRGNYSSAVKLTWQVRQVGTEECYFTLQRRPLGTAGDEGWADIYTTHGTARSYSYDDQTAQTGSFNEYKLILSEKKDGTVLATQTAKTDGFCMSFGTLSGRVSFGSGTAVKGVKVTLRPQNSDGKTVNSFRSLYFAGSGAGMNCVLDSVYLRKLMQGDFTYQLWLNPDNSKMSGNGKEYLVADVKNAFSIYLKYDSGNKRYRVGSYVNGSIRYDDAYIPANLWSHVTVTHSGNSTKVYVSDQKNNIQEYEVCNDQDIDWGQSEKVNNIALANSGTFNFTRHYEGLIDEFRLFNRALSLEDVERNFSHPLIGSEEGLQIYYSFDEGLENQKIAYDFSKQNGISNGHHATAKVAAQSSQMIPTEDQFSLMGYTDAEGNYMVGGILFSGDGTNYVATPSLGVHKFSPANQSRFFTNSSLVQSGVDFKDESSFPVSGVVYFDGTTIPVQDASIYVDGNIAAKDGDAVKTNENGEFTVDVPIGEHFVQVKKEGHTFVGNGRYPEDPNGVSKREKFDSEVTGLTFYDNTRVVVAGRVAGGDLEYMKPLGLHQGQATIGKARLTLTYSGSESTLINAEKKVDDSAVSYSQSTVRRDFNATQGTAFVEGGKNKVTIETDAGTGEWVAELLPLLYTVETVTIPSNPAINFSGLPVIDATNPLITYTDSVPETDLEFKYVASAKIKHKTPTVLRVVEHEDGSYGEQEIEVTGLDGTKETVSLYTVENGVVNYRFGHPIYKELSDYTYQLHAYESYVNYDGAEPVESIVPLADAEVTIENQFSTAASVYIEGNAAGEVEGTVAEIEANTFNLDSEGRATYTFTAGYPNVKGDFTRGISIAYDDNGTMTSWSGNATLRPIVLGALTTGNNFTTQAPDQVMMILRDPPGSGSSATFSKGHKHTVKGTMSLTNKMTVGVEQENTFKQETQTLTGVGVATSIKTKFGASATVGIESKTTVSTDNTWVHEITSKQDITTDDGKHYVGAPGDIFIGSSKNMLFGTCHRLRVKKDESSATPKYDLVVEDAMETGMQFGTEFYYTQKHIENTLIPSYLALRNSLLVQIANLDNVARPEVGSDPIYVSKLAPSDSRYGSSNCDAEVWGKAAVPASAGLNIKEGYVDGPSYRIVLPMGWFDATNPRMGVMQDMVQHYNQQVKGWQKQLALNEEMKVQAIQNRDTWLNKNVSFDAGTTIKEAYTSTDKDTHTFEFTEDFSTILDLSTEGKVNGIGYDITLSYGEEIEGSAGYENTDEDSEGFSYELVEGGAGGYLSVDIFNAPDGHGPIFYTYGGATSCPYEGEVVTKYYQPGTVIAEATVQIEKPEIEPLTQVVTGVPAGGEATIQVILRNNSDTHKDRWYNLDVVDTSNPDGLQVFVDGLNITEGRTIKIPASNEVEKTFMFRQTKLDKLEYRNIQLRLASDCEVKLNDVKTVSVFFQPTCSDVALSATHRRVNTETETTQTLSISGYNYSMTTLKGIRLQMKGENDADFKTIQEYSKDADLVASDPNLLLLPSLEGTNRLDYTIDLRDDKYTDQTYVFRAITVCDQSGEEVNNESDEIVIVRDMTRPQLIAQPSPASGILGSGDDLTITFNEDIQGGIIEKAKNFEMAGVLNEGEVAHEVALSLTGENAARTEGTIDLSGKSFTASMWVNCLSDGRLLTHGTASDHFAVGIDQGKLVVTVNQSEIVSDNDVPMDKWFYLNVSYNADESTVTAAYASDDQTEYLLMNRPVAQYQGNGPVSLGGHNLTAEVQELTLWNSARSMAEAQGDMYTTKSRYTSGLLGYWQFDEGHGSVATDCARSRNMTLPSESAWWIHGDNHALVLDGATAATADIGALNTRDYEDYLVEAWFKADEQQDGEASVLSTLAMDLRLSAQGRLELCSVNSGNSAQSPVNGGNSAVYTTVYDKDLRDGQWHHVAVNVLKSTNGSGIVYVDGQQRKQFAASMMPILYGDKLVLGAHKIEGSMAYDQLLRGAVDEVRIWKGRRTADVIKNNMYNRVRGSEAGLVAYYPMESFGLDQFNQTVYAASYEDAVGDQELSFFDIYGLEGSGQTTSANTAALKPAPRKENVAFSFVASERKVKVSLEELPARIEGCHISITVKEVKDKNGNTAQPITWTVYVQQNNLRWQESDVAVVKTGLEKAEFTATIENRGSESESWSLSGMPSWLSASAKGGTLSPLASGKLKFTVDEGLPIGTYETTVYVTGSQNIATPLNVTVTSEGDAPNWVATQGESTMTIVGVLSIGGVQSSDPKDMVAAFRGTECVGLAHPQYLSRYDSYMILLSIYGEGQGEEAGLTYKAYDASTGTVYPSVGVDNENAMTFAPDKSIGFFTNPAVFTTLNEIKQDLSHNKASWKWFSLYAQPKVNDVSVVFKDAKDAIKAITDGQNSIVAWSGTLSSFDYDRMYKLNATKPFVETVIGEPTNPEAIDITLNGNGWTWLGYPCQGINSLDAAFASVAKEGDMVKGQSSFSIYTEGEWMGALPAMQPGEGYMYCNTGAAKTFHFPKPTISGRKNAQRTLNNQNYQSNQSILNFKDNMTMIAVVMRGEEVIEDAEVSVYAGTDLRGYSAGALRNDRHFITIGGEDAEMLTYVVRTAEGDCLLQQADIFQADAMKGSMAQPYVLQLSESTGIDMALKGIAIRSVQLIDNGGRVISNGQKLYTKDDLKRLPAGVYYQQVTFANGQTRVQKLMR